MDIVGMGTEIVECLRIGRMIESHGERFLSQVYTPREIRFCNERKRPLEHFAALWAAKEAVLKALALAGRGLDWTDIEVQQEGRPEVRLTGAVRDAAARQGIGSVMLSLARCRAYATATALALTSAVGG